MGDFRQSLLKAGLVTEEEARDFDARESQKRRKTRQQVRSKKEAREATDAAPKALSEEELKKLHLWIDEGRLGAKASGQARWYYRSRSGAVPFLSLNTKTVKGLEDGSYALVEDEQGLANVVTQGEAEKIRGVDPSWIRYG